MRKRLLQTRNSITINKDMVSRQNIRNKEHIIVTGVTHMISNTTMNGIFYPESEVKALAANIGTSRVTMPASHPTGENGEFISASDPWALTSNFIGAYAFNFSIRGDRLISDVAIDPLFASTSDDGKAILNAIETGSPVDISTGFYLNVEEKEGFGSDGEPFDMIASNLNIDHSAFLPNEDGAKSKLEGVGLHTNSASLDGVTIDTDVALLQTNASTPAMKLPLATDNHVWNESIALSNIKAYTNSSDGPSTSFRKFFLNFDQDKVDDFDSYHNLFADVINGVPHAVKQPIANASDNEHAKVYANRFSEVATNSKDGFVKRVLNKVFSIMQSNELSHEDTHNKIYKKLNEGRSDSVSSFWPMEVFDDYFVYRGDNDKLYRQSYSSVDDEITFIGERSEVERIVEFKPIINSGDSKMDRKDIIALLVNKGVSIKEDISDDELKAALNKALGDKVEPQNNANQDEPEWAKVLAAKVDGLQTQVNANSDKELTKARADVVAVNKGVDSGMAAVMTLEHCNKFLASHGQSAVGVNGQHKQTNSDEAVALPE